MDHTKIRKVLNDTVLVKKMPKPEMTKSGLVLPHLDDDKREPEMWAAKIILINCADGFWKAGDIVLIEPASLDCPSFKDGDDSFFFIKQEDIICLQIDDDYMPSPGVSILERIYSEKKGVLYIPNPEKKLSLKAKVIKSGKFEKDRVVYYNKNSALLIKDKQIALHNYNVIGVEGTEAI